MTKKNPHAVALARARVGKPVSEARLKAAAAALARRGARKGGSVTSEAKTAAVRLNGRLGGKPPRIDEDGNMHVPLRPLVLDEATRQMLAAALHRPGLATRAEVQTWAEHGLALALEELKTLGENPRGGTGEC